MAFLTTTTSAVSLRSPLYRAPRRRPVLLTAVMKATPTSDATPPRPILSTLGLAASAAVLLAATSPALAWAPFAPRPRPPPAPATATVSRRELAIPEDYNPTFEKYVALIVGALTFFGDADKARDFLSDAASWGGESCAHLLAAMELFVDGKADEALAAFEKLAREDPGDYRPLFCQALLYWSLHRYEEFVAVLARCREVAGDKCDPELAKIFSEIEEDTGRGKR